MGSSSKSARGRIAIARERDSLAFPAGEAGDVPAEQRTEFEHVDRLLNPARFDRRLYSEADVLFDITIGKECRGLGDPSEVALVSGQAKSRARIL